MWDFPINVKNPMPQTVPNIIDYDYNHKRVGFQLSPNGSFFFYGTGFTTG